MGRRSASSNVFLAIADPTRRRLLDMLCAGERPAGELARPFRMSQPALSQHLRILREVGLVRQRKAGRERIYRLDPIPLHSVAEWMMRYERFWRERLEALGKYLDSQP